MVTDPILLLLVLLKRFVMQPILPTTPYKPGTGSAKPRILDTPGTKCQISPQFIANKYQCAGKVKPGGALN
jgi:hypothetical protein